MSGLELNNVVKRFGEVTVVQQMDLAIGDGEFVVLLGVDLFSVSKLTVRIPSNGAGSVR